MTTALIISPSPAVLPDRMIQRQAGAAGFWFKRILLLVPRPGEMLSALAKATFDSPPGYDG